LILVVDDHGGNAYVLRRVLMMEGYQAAAVTSGRAALEFLRGNAVSLVVLDYQMPEIDGIGVFRQMKADPALRDIPVIMFSAYDGKAREEALREGVAAWVMKGSLDLASLRRHVVRLIGPGKKVAGLTGEPGKTPSKEVG
jgi:CheY-like chemotaxis protein